MSRQQDLEDALKNVTDLTVSPGIGIATSNINESNVKGYYHALKAMGLATGLDSSSSIENVLKVWVDNKPIIQECESISFEGKFITEFPYDALDEMNSLVGLDIYDNKLLTIDPEKFETLKAKLKSIRFSSCRMSPATFDAISNCECLEKLDLSNTPFKKIFRTGNYSWGKLKDTLIELNISRINMTTRTLNIIAELKSLRILHVSKNNLGDISNCLGFKNLSNLTELNISSNPLTRIPDGIGSLSNLTELNLSDNQLTSIPKSIGNLSNLTKLDLYSNQLTSIPESIGNLLNLTELNLSNNQLTSIPESIGNLKNLPELNLSYNRLTSIPDRIGDLKNLAKLYLSDNQLTSIPESIGDLKNLPELNLSYNRLTSIPDRIGDLKNLAKLYLSCNRLTSIPDCIGDLKNLARLDLSYNRLTSIPDRIGDLKNLTGLGLSYNKLTSVPSTIRNLRNTLGYVDISNNDGIVLYGDSEASFGLEQLIEMFGRRLRYTEPRIIPITIKEVYKQLMKMPIHWDFDRLKQLGATPIPQIDMTMDEMMAIWKRLSEEGIDESNANAMTGFIHDIYNPDEQYNRDWPMASEYLQLSKNLLGSVLNILSMKSETDKELVESNLNNICEGLKRCNDRKLSELRLAYYTLIDKLDNQDETLDGLINSIISNEKETMFDFTFIRDTSQSVHVQRYWKYRLRDEVGFDFDVDTGFDTYGQDPFNEHPGNALSAFYSNFTPEHAIEVLTIRINQKENHTHMSELMKTIVNDNELSIEEKKSMLIGDIETCMLTGITRKGVKYYLLKRGLIIQNQRQQSVWSCIKHIFTLFIGKIFCCSL